MQDSRDVWSPLALPTKPDAQYVSPKAELVLEVGGGKTPLYSFDEVLTTIRYQGRPGNLLRNDELASHVYYAPGSQRGAKSALVDLIGVSHILCAGNLLGGQESWPGFWQPQFCFQKYFLFHTKLQLQFHRAIEHFRLH